jgi:hypothetical protein
MWSTDNLMIYRGPDFLAPYDLAPHPSPLSHQQVVSLSQSAYELTDRRGGMWRRRSQIITNNHDKLLIFRFPRMRAAAASLLFLLLRFTHPLNFFF